MFISYLYLYNSWLLEQILPIAYNVLTVQGDIHNFQLTSVVCCGWCSWCVNVITLLSTVIDVVRQVLFVVCWGWCSWCVNVIMFKFGNDFGSGMISGPEQDSTDFHSYFILINRSQNTLGLAQQQQLLLNQQILALNNSPFGDSKLFRNSLTVSFKLFCLFLTLLLTYYYTFSSTCKMQITVSL